MMSRSRALALITLLSFAACGGPPAEGLSIEPVVLGGEHAKLFDTALGPMVGYRIRHGGKAKSFRVECETFVNGESAHKTSLIAGGFPSGATDAFDGVLGLIVTEPRRDGATTEITGVLQLGGTLIHSDAQLEVWDRSVGEREGVSYAEWREAKSFAEVGDGVALWRWTRDQAAPLSGLDSPRSKDAATVFEVRLRIDG